MNSHLCHHQSSQLLTVAAPLLPSCANIIDIACGSGRNGFELARQGHHVTYLDKDPDALDTIINTQSDATTIQADLECDSGYQLPSNQFDAVLVFRYLHRPLFNSIVDAIKPGGLIIYETFNWQQANIGRPRNPNFLLTDNELCHRFSAFTQHHYFQGYCSTQQAYISQYIGKKP